MDKQTAYQTELSKWTELFAETTPATQKAAEGSIQKAAYIHSLCWELDQAISLSGAIKVHPVHPELQKQVLAVKEYARLCESYANIVKRLNNLRSRNAVEDDDELSDFG